MVGKQGWPMVTSELGIREFLQSGFPSHARASGVTAKRGPGGGLESRSQLFQTGVQHGLLLA